ncbi:MAG: hypothetical protein AB2A00_25225 [Myxococcota bacterium]
MVFAASTVLWCVMAAGAGDAELLRLVDKAIDRARRIELRTDEVTPWVVMHATIPFGRGAEVYEVSRKQRVNAVQWLLESATFEGQRIFHPVPGGLGSWAPPGKKEAVQGHRDQYLAKLGRAGVRRDEKILLPDGSFTVADLVSAAKRNVRPEYEASWTLTALLIYEGFDAKWKNADGEDYDIPRLVRTEVSVDPNLRGCGGTHNIFALADTLSRRRSANLPITGVYQEAQEKVERYVRMAAEWQGDAGDYSAGFFARNVRPRDDHELIHSTGHTLEVMAQAATDAQLHDEKLQRAVRLTAQRLLAVMETGKDVRLGALFHAVDGLVIYRQRLTRR